MYDQPPPEQPPVPPVQHVVHHYQPYYVPVPVAAKPESGVKKFIFVGGLVALALVLSWFMWQMQKSSEESDRADDIHRCIMAAPSSVEHSEAQSRCKADPHAYHW